MKKKRYSSSQEEAIKDLLSCDSLDKHIAKYSFQNIVEDKNDIPQYLTSIGDDIVHRLVCWTHQLPFYSQIDVKLHTQLLTAKWHEILLLSTLYSMCKNTLASHLNRPSNTFEIQLDRNLRKLQYYLLQVCNLDLTIEKLHQESGEMMEKITLLIQTFEKLDLLPEEYVCLKVLLLLSKANAESGSKLRSIQEHYLDCLQAFVEEGPQSADQKTSLTRFGELLLLLPRLQAAAELLLSSKMFYVPFLLNSLTLPEDDINKTKSMETNGKDTNAQNAVSEQDITAEEGTSKKSPLTYDDKKTPPTMVSEDVSNESMDQSLDLRTNVGSKTGNQNPSDVAHASFARTEMPELEEYQAPLQIDLEDTSAIGSPSNDRSQYEVLLESGDESIEPNQLRQLLEAPIEIKSKNHD